MYILISPCDWSGSSEYTALADRRRACSTVLCFGLQAVIVISGLKIMQEAVHKEEIFLIGHPVCMSAFLISFQGKESCFFLLFEKTSSQKGEILRKEEDIKP